MTQFSASHEAAGLIDGMGHAAEHARASAQAFAHHSQADMVTALQTLIHDVGPKLNSMAEQLGALSHQGSKSVAAGSHYLSEQAHHAADATRGYIRKEPTTSVLLAAGLGALLVAAWVAASQMRSAR
ncbi:MAG: hypothetical protein K2W33_15230 [Burkholderiales bacterium]|nr:hypothetical protein [Burkholderiales bacterium]